MQKYWNWKRLLEETFNGYATRIYGGQEKYEPCSDQEIKRSIKLSAVE